MKVSEDSSYGIFIGKFLMGDDESFKGDFNNSSFTSTKHKHDMANKDLGTVSLLNRFLKGADPWVY